MLWGLYLYLSISDIYNYKDTPKIIACILIWSIGAAAFGYFLNDCFDAEHDKKAGKINFSASLSFIQKALILIACAAVAISPWVYLQRNILLLIVGIHLSTFVLYSVPPVRLKDKFYLGVFTDALYSFFLPVVLLVVLAFGIDINLLPFYSILLLVWSLAAGLRTILQHHITDRHTDAKANSHNVTRYGLKINILLINLALAVEIVTFLWFAFSFDNYFKNFQVLLWATVPLYILFIIQQLFTANRYGIQFKLYRKLATGKIQLNGYYEEWLPVVLLLIFAVKSWQGSISLLLFLILFKSGLVIWFYRVVIKRFLVGIIFYGIVVNFFHHVVLKGLYAIKSIISLSVNYSIYYYRRRFLKQDDRTARRLSEEQYAKYLAGKQPENTTEKGIENFKALIKSGELLAENKVVHGLWIGEYLSDIELLTISTYIAQGHEFNLWLYNSLKTPLPQGTVVKNANEILPASKIFRYKYANKYGHGKGSVSGFSDIFRYKLLYEHGGWWTDMDVTCLHPLNIVTPYFFRQHHDLLLVGNLMKCPKGSELMKKCFEQASADVDENNTDWHKPIAILNDNVVAQGLDKYIISHLTNQDKWDEVTEFVTSKKRIPAHYIALHWMNEEWRSRNLNKYDIRINSTLGQLMMKYGIKPKVNDNWDLFKNDLRHIVWLRLYNYLS